MPSSRRAAIITPHAPALVLAAHDGVPALQNVRNALGSIERAGLDLVCVLSPHGRSSGVYTSPRADLGEFGIAGHESRWDADEAAAGVLADAWGRGRLREMPDHGVVVPLSLMRPASPVVAAAVAESLSPAEQAEEGAAFGRAVAASYDGVTLVVSAHGSCALSPHAPLTERPGARAAENAFLEFLQSDVEKAADAAVELAERFGSCAPAGIAALAAFSPDARLRIVAYEEPFGVGYLVAHTQ